MDHFRDLVCWQLLSHELKCEVFAFTATGPAAHDFRFRDQIRDSSASAARNIAEGFGRYVPGDFARFLGFAKGSLAETRNSLLDARERGYISERAYARLNNLAGAAERTTTNLMLSKLRQAAASRKGR